MDEILKMFGGAENLWASIQENAAKVGIEATRVMLELFYVLKSPDTSMLNKSLIVAALGYQLLPRMPCLVTGSAYWDSLTMA